MLQDRLAGLGESGDIIRSMKNLAYMETRKLDRLIVHQRGVVQQIDAVAADFLSFYPETLPVAPPSHPVYLVFGSRRGFCGDFNERLVLRLQRELAGAQAGHAAVIAVGHKLCRRAETEIDLAAALEGADVVEEIPSVLRAIVNELDARRDRQGTLSLQVLYHRAASAEPVLEQLLPPFDTHRGAPQPYTFAPLLNLAPRDFLLELSGQYLFAALHALLFESLLAENERRVRHLDGAVRHLEERVGAIQRRVRALRQEEIIEEIEVILLNALSLDQPAAGARAGEDV
jgi:F-type H+-transporting ATPase subunit gamma